MVLLKLLPPDIRPVPIVPALALSLPIALVLTMIKGRRLLLPGRLVERRQRIEPVAQAAADAGP